MFNSRIQKVVIITLSILLVSVAPAIMLSSDNNTVELALAQSANQTTLSSTAPSPTPQAMQSTFYAKGVNGILVLDPNAIQGAPPPSKYFGTIVGGNWSLDVVNRSIQNFTMNLLSIRPNGTVAETAIVSTITNDTAISGASPSNATTLVSSNNTNNNNNTTSSTTTNNSTVLQGVANISINGTVRWRDVPLTLTMMDSTLINISIDSTKTENQFGSLPIHGIIMSMTDENGRNLLPGLPYFISGTSAPTQFSGLPPLPPGGGPPGTGPMERSTQIGTIPTNQTCTLTPSLIEVEDTPQATEGPYFVDEMLNRSDIRPDPTDGSVQQGVPLTLVLHVYDVDEGRCSPLKGAQVDVWHANAMGQYSDIEQAGTAGTKFLRGYQTTDDNGTVRFTTIYPGWYQGRAVHLHFKVRMFEGSEKTLEFTSQFFFNDTVSDQVYSQPPYNDRGNRDVRNNQDGIFNGASTDGLVQSHVGEHLMLNTTKQDQGYLGTFNMGLKLNQTGQ
jgi:protocatechuate 3,4-dioxygenase beta subunit